MSKITIKVVFFGHVPHSINRERISKWRSNLFEVTDSIKTIKINGDSDGSNWEFTDVNIDQLLPERNGVGILFAVTNITLDDSYY